MREVDFHKSLERLFSEIDASAEVNITHSSTELGADLVVIRKDDFRESISSVVVSMGHLRGETGAKVERISSQIKQSMDIPRKIGTRVEEVQTTEIWLVIAGEISEGARKRLKFQLKPEYKGVLNFMDIDWLIQKFTDKYPEVFFGGETLDFIEERIEQLENITSLSRKVKDNYLSEWYVDPYLSTGGIPIEIDEGGNKITIKSQRVQFNTLRSIAEKETKVIVYGEPGVGKTTALSKLVLDNLKQISDSVIGQRGGENIKLPVMLTAHELLDCDSCESLIEKCINAGQLKPGFLIGILIIDGLDEVKKDFRKVVIEKAADLCGEMDWKLIIGSRKLELIKSLPRGIISFELMPFEVNQAIKLFEKIVKETKLLSTLKEGLTKVAAQLPMTPMSLSILIEIAEEQGEVPASLADLYSRYFEMVLGKWDFRDKGIESLFQFETKLHFLSELAWCQLVKSNNVEISEDEFKAFVTQYISRFGFDGDWITKFIAEIERAGIIEIKDVISFKHRSFLDYFAAFYIYHHQDELDDVCQIVTDLYYSDLWSDIAFYYVGIGTRITRKLLERINANPAEDFSTRISKYTIGRLLQAGWLSELEIKTQGIDKALEQLLPIKEILLESFSRTQMNPGLIFADFLPVLTAEWTMGSITLLQALKKVESVLLEDNSRESYWKEVATMWSIWKFLSNEEKRDHITGFLERISTEKNLSNEDKSTLLILMASLEDNNKSIKLALHRRLTRFAKINPEMYKKFLPPVKEGFRKKQRK